MFSIKWVIFMVFMLMVGGLLGIMLELGSMSDTTISEQVNALVLMELVRIPVSGGGEIRMPKPNEDFFAGLWQAVTFDFAFLTGEWELLRMIVFGSISAGIVFGMAYLFISILRGAI